MPNGVYFNERLAVSSEQLAADREQLTTSNVQSTGTYSPSTDKCLRIAFIGRFNGGKGERAAALLQRVFPPLLAEFPALRLALIGGELDAACPPPARGPLAQLQAQFGERVEVVGFTDDVAGWLARTTLTIGAGRVAIEALGAGHAVLALGEASYAGLVTEANFADAAASNFGDISARVTPSAVDFGALLADARAFLAAPQPVPGALQAQVRAHYDLARVAAEVLVVYQSARMKKAVPDFLPVLMYHKIPAAPPATQHQTFVTKGQTLPGTWPSSEVAASRPSPSPTTCNLPAASGPWPGSRGGRMVLTFDDGYLDNYTNLLPLMQQYGYRGVLYLLGDFSRALQPVGPRRRPHRAPRRPHGRNPEARFRSCRLGNRGPHHVAPAPDGPAAARCHGRNSAAAKPAWKPRMGKPKSSASPTPTAASPTT